LLHDRYYNWRQDGVSDLLLITAVSTTLLITAALIKWLLVDPTEPADLQQLLQGPSAAAGGDATVAAAAAPVGTAARAVAGAAAPVAPDLTAAVAAGDVADGVPASSSSSSSHIDAMKQWLAAFGTAMYQVMVLSFGENFPSPDNGEWECCFDGKLSLTFRLCEYVVCDARPMACCWIEQQLRWLGTCTQQLRWLGSCTQQLRWLGSCKQQLRWLGSCKQQQQQQQPLGQRTADHQLACCYLWVQVFVLLRSCSVWL
jgi:hypothetical protein